ncbi:TPA: hypothetical protein ACGIKW_003308 [Acinetobacter baumannii]|uniref:hypothetical protein n=1 Tax=Acinetobacter baumannii TaxID=470 RepID=UPI00338DE322
MTMIISAHLGDVILIAADKRAMSYNFETNQLSVSHNNESKIQLWCRGAIAGTGDIVFIKRIMKKFSEISIENRKINQLDIIVNELNKRLNEGLTKDFLNNNTIVFSIFDGEGCSLYSMPIKAFLEPQYIHECLQKVEAGTVEVCCLNIPPDLNYLKDFQNNLRSFHSFDNGLQFLNNYVDQLKQIFALQASVDSSVTPAFDLYLQSCLTGQSIAVHVENNLLS